jgi:hypothetical protein
LFAESVSWIETLHGAHTTDKGGVGERQSHSQDEIEAGMTQETIALGCVNRSFPDQFVCTLLLVRVSIQLFLFCRA